MSSESEQSGGPAAEPAGLPRILLLLLVGGIGGTFSGALGVGGGVIMVPLMLWLLRMDQRRAAATSLLAIVPAAIAGSFSYGLAGQVDLLAAGLIAIGGIVGSLVGTRLLRTLPLGWLRWGFVGLLVLIAIRMFLEVPSRAADLEYSPWAVAGLIALGLVMGIASGLFGIGGGVLMVPVLVALFGAGDLLSKGISLLAMIPTSITGTVANLRARLVRATDGLVIGLAATAASFGGAAIAFLLPPRVSSIVFGCLVAFVAVQLAWRAWRQGRAGR